MTSSNSKKPESTKTSCRLFPSHKPMNSQSLAGFFVRPAILRFIRFLISSIFNPSLRLDHTPVFLAVRKRDFSVALCFLLSIILSLARLRKNSPFLKQTMLKH